MKTIKQLLLTIFLLSLFCLFAYLFAINLKFRVLSLFFVMIFLVGALIWTVAGAILDDWS